MGLVIYDQQGNVDLVLGAPPAPLKPLEPLAELVTTLCPDCSGVGFHEAVSAAGVDYSERCTTCYGRGAIDVCSKCGEIPSIETDQCGCLEYSEVAPCELCDRTRPLNAARVCEGCHETGREFLAAERSKHESWFAEELSWALSVGLVTKEQVGL